MRLAIYGSRRQDSYLPQIEGFMNELSRRGDTAVMHAKLYEYLLRLMPVALKCVERVTDGPDFTADYAVSIGGDGSFLRTAAWVADKEIPILGVNTGHLGFLASLGVDDLPQLPALLERGDFTLQSHSLIHIAEPALDVWPYALNEVTVGKAETSSIITVNVLLSDIHLANYRADGLIVCTPTGSTAYNLSVGGPIVQPTAPVFVISPIAAHSLSMRPLVIDDTSALTLHCDSRKPRYRLSIDGRSSVFDLSQPVKLCRAPFVVKSILLPGHNFADTLRNKLSWG